MPLLKRVDRDITIRHHWTGEALRLHVFRHRGYWYHGKRREQETMTAFAKLIAAGDHVIEVGGHIGYITMYLGSLVGAKGSVTVFEPSPNNLRYLTANIAAKPWIELREAALTNYTGTATFYTEDLTGQNSSLLQSYWLRDLNQEFAFVDNNQSAIQVRCTSLDAYLAESGAPAPSLIKVDVEGAELAVLEGMQHTLRSNKVALMVEITVETDKVLALLSALDYRLFSVTGQRVVQGEPVRGNVFCFRSDDPRARTFAGFH